MAAESRARSAVDSLPRVPRWAFAAGAALAAVLFGRLVADGKMKYGFAIVLAAAFMPVVLFDLAASFAAYVGITFFQNLSFLSSLPNAIGVLVALGWLGTFLTSHRAAAVVREHGRILLTIVFLCIWVTLSIAWAPQTGAAGTEAGYWWLAALAFLIALTTLSGPREISYVLIAFIMGSVISVLIGLATGGLNTSDATSSTTTAIQGRFTGGSGDPNLEAAAFVATMFLIMGMLSVYRSARARFWLVVSFVIVTIGFIATESRGGLLALAVAAIAALVLSPRHRKRIVGLLATALVAAGVLLIAQPGSLSRITDFGGGSSGRSDLWRVAWHVFTGHPFVGVGIANFVVVEANYVLEPGTISRIQYIVEQPHLVHNSYLQVLAETGVIGLAAFLAVLWVTLRAGWRAIKEFEAKGLTNYADLVRAVLMGTIGMLAADFFISDGNDPLLWVLLSLGPVLLTLARGSPPAAAADAGSAAVP